MKIYWYFCYKCGIPLKDYNDKEIEIKCPQCNSLMEVLPKDSEGYNLLQELTGFAQENSPFS